MAGIVNVLVGNITTGVTAESGGDAWVLTRDSGIYASFGLGNAAGAMAQRFLIEGTISTYGNGVEAGTGGYNQLTVTATGIVQGGNYGLRAAGTVGNNGVVNAGLVTADLTGVHVAGAQSDILNTGIIEARYFGIVVASTFATLSQPGATIVNSGQISAATGISAGGGRNTITNDGLIAGGTISIVLGTGYGIRVSDDNNTVANNGTISGASYGIGTSGNDNTVTNTGRIEAAGTGIRIGEGNRNMVVNSGEISVGVVPSGYALPGHAGVMFQGLTTGLSGTFRNSGTVQAASGTAVSGSIGDEMVVNDGILGGSVLLGNGTILSSTGGTSRAPSTSATATTSCAACRAASTATSWAERATI